MTVTFDPVALVLGAAAVLGALGYLIRIARKVVRWCRAMATVVDKELTHNHGTSMKDDVVGIAHAVGELQRNVEDLGSNVRDLSAELYNHLAERTPKTP